MAARRQSRRRLAALISLGILIALAAPHAPAQAVPGPAAGDDGPGGLANVDRRYDADRRHTPAATQRQALTQLGDVEVGWSEHGTPASLLSRSGALTKSSKARPDTIARSFVREQRDLFGLSAADVARLRLTMHDSANGATFLRYQQTHQGRDVYGATLLVVTGPDGQLFFAGGDLVPNLSSAPAARLDAADAVKKMAKNVNPEKRAEPGKRLGTRDGVTRFQNTMGVPDLPDPAPIAADLVTVATEQGIRTAWRLDAEVASNARYTLLMDASTGEVLLRENQILNDSAHGLAHTGDDPEAGSQVADVPFPSPWVDAGGDTTSGNNTNTYQDADGDNTAHAGDQPHDADQHFDYPWTDPWGSGDGSEGALPVAGDERDAVVTQLFYYTNWFHDYSYNLGFTESARNFQNDNFGNGGSDGDAVEAESDANFLGEQCKDNDNNDVPCRNNANFTTNGPDGNKPRMQMYVGDTTNPDGTVRRTQRANNRDTVIHEYAHGITGRIISNTNLAGGEQSGALGEGWSDAFATSINNDPVYGEYNNGNYNTGIRGVAYDNDNLEYGDFDGDAGVHSNGRIWAMNMWETRAALIAKYGFGAGKSRHEQLMMTGLKLTPDTPSYHDARTAYLLADWAHSGFDFGAFPEGDNWCRIWAVFADNELGVTDSPDSDTETNPTVSTETPEDCDPTASIAAVPDTPEGTEITFDASASQVGGDSGDTLSYAWDLDNDGQYDDSTKPNPIRAYGDNGSRTVGLRVTNSSGYTDTASVTFTITNVAPTVTIDPAQLKSALENQSRSVKATFNDPGWQDTYTSNVDLGTAHLPDVPGAVSVTSPGGMGSADSGGATPDVGETTATITYGDNGDYTVTVSVTDDDGGTNNDTFVMAADNVDPTAVIDTSGEQSYGGQSAFILEAGEDLTVPASSEDPGSDDLTFLWDWDGALLNGETPDQQTSLVNPPDPDQPLSPTIQPRNVELSKTHAYGAACLYHLEVTVTDDDLGSASDSAVVLITGNADVSKGHGWWLNQYRDKAPNDFTPETLQCYLEIVNYLSLVFSEETDASNREAAARVLNAPAKSPAAVVFDQHALGAWLNFANGSVKLDTLVDTDGDSVVDTSFGDVMATAEAVRVDPNSTEAEIKAQKDIIERIATQSGG